MDDQLMGLRSEDGTTVPLVGVDVRGEVLGASARFVVRQRYRNAEKAALEAVYTFPVPSDAALAGFAMESDGRRVEAKVEARDAAFRAYDDAIAKGHGAALLDEERPNVFRARVGNLLPGEETVVEVVYVQRLEAREGALRVVVPTVVAPRYAPAGTASPSPPVRDPYAASGRPVDPVLTLEVTFRLGREVTVESPSHANRVEGSRARLDGAPLDRDVVLLASGDSTAGVVAHKRAGADGTFALTVVPDLAVRAPRARFDVVFVVDVSGSMAGTSIDQARAAMRLCLRQLAEGDRFGMIAFSTSHRAFAPGLVPYTQRTLDEADRWVDALEAEGGTEMLSPLLAAASALHGDRERLIVLLTDGQVANEAQIAEHVVGAARGARVLAFGIGTAVSDLLLGELARRTRGAYEGIHPGERIDDKVTAQFARARAARVEGVTLRWEGVDAGEVAPSELPDLVDGQPWSVLGRYARAGVGRAEVRGKLRGETFYLAVPVELPAEADAPALEALWASARVRELEIAERTLDGRRADANRRRIVELSIAHQVTSSHTSFVVVDTREGARRTSGTPATRVVPVSAPAGWAMFHAARPTGRPMPPAPGMMQAMAGGFGAPPVARGTTYAPPPRCAAPAMPPPPGACAPMPRRAPSPAPMQTRAPDGLDALFARQLASGLWEDADATDAGRLRATATALEAAARDGLDAGHAKYGAQIRKAIEAVCALVFALRARGPVPDAAKDALAACLATAGGKRLRAVVDAVAARMA